jgi:hypothetical protein
MTKNPANPTWYRYVYPSFRDSNGKRSTEVRPRRSPEMLMMMPMLKLERPRPPYFIGVAYSSGNIEVVADSIKAVKP